LRLGSLVFLRLNRPAAPLVVLYGQFPRYLRGICKLLKVPPRIIETSLRGATGIRLQKIEFDYENAAKSTFDPRDLEKIATIAEQLIPEVETDPWVLLLAELIGKQPAEAFVLRFLCHHEIFYPVLCILACEKQSTSSFSLIWNPSWPARWLDVIKENLRTNNCEFFIWPRWICFLWRIYYAVAFPLRLAAITIYYLATRGVTYRQITKAHFKLITEFIDPSRLNGSPYDADFWADGSHIKPAEILFILTGEQKRLLTREGYRIKEVVRQVQTKGYSIQVLDDLPYAPETVRSLLAVAARLSGAFRSGKARCLGDAFCGAWRAYLDYANLFSHYEATSLLHFTFPNGNTGWRLDGPVVTGLCRRRGIRSVGCQTHLIYIRYHEFCFECYDLYLTWGTIWPKVLGSAMRFVERIVPVGCFYLDGLLPIYRDHVATHHIREHGGRLRVTVFPGDVCSRHYPLSHTLAFLKDCARLAPEHPDVAFRIKCKNLDDPEILLAQPDFAQAYSQAPGNLSFVRLPRSEYSNLLVSSDFVLAIGYTTPGTEALLLGIPTLYYDGLKLGGATFGHIPGLSVHNFDELSARFQEMLAQNSRTTGSASHDGLDLLDHYRDGHTRERIVKLLMEA
jgi:hypothetical protein